MSKGYVDTHAHLYAEEFSGEIDDVITRARESGVSKIILPNIDTGTIEDMLMLCDDHPDLCFPALGLHPTSVSGNYKSDLDQLATYFNKRKFFGIGETGIDLYWDTSFEKEQVDAFRIQLGWAKEKNLPVIIHTRNAFDLVYGVVNEFRGTVRGVFHCFTGTLEEAEKIISLETFKMGIGGVITYKNSALPDVIEKISLEHLILETDSPYLPPVPFRGKRNESSYILKIAEKVASTKKCSVEEIAEITKKNAEEIFG